MALTAHACCLPESRNQSITDLRYVRRVARGLLHQIFIFPLCPPQDERRIAESRNERGERTERQGRSRRHNHHSQIAWMADEEIRAACYQLVVALRLHHNRCAKE